MAEKSKHKITIIGGIILFIIGIIGAIWSFYIFLPNPAEVAEAKLNFDYDEVDSSDTSEFVYLSEGKYDIWYEPSLFNIGILTDVEVRDPDGELIFNKLKFLDTSDSISRDGNTYKKFGEFKAETSGEYNFTAFSSSTIYITPTINIGLAKGLGYSFIVLGIVGIIILLIGIGLLFSQKSKEAKAKQGVPPPPSQPPYPQSTQQPYYYPYPYHYPPPPPPPPPK
jgi:hypothetical protein